MNIKEKNSKLDKNHILNITNVMMKPCKWNKTVIIFKQFLLHQLKLLEI